MANENDEELQVDEDKQKSGGNNLIVMIAAVLLGLGIGAIGVYFFLGGSGDEPEEEAVAAEEVRVKTLYYKVEKPFVVNFQGSKGRQRYMQVDTVVRGKDQAALDYIDQHLPVIRSKLSALFTGQLQRELQTEAGLLKMNEDATQIVKDYLLEETGSEGIEQVLFTNLVMQ